MKQPKRICIYPKDVSEILGKSIKHAERLLRTIRDALGKESHQYVSFKEFADYTGLDEGEIRERCGW
ncbi:hypothetical protein [Parapedobacter koreensis]|uniref:Uncharacterized protein n=1 Tax=Parapedobacter koreensis TaxID=332977 RepID=A0A1H7Q336_9SPHI|nr:hypothetical protein [Parapedobacter koreensis]SEL41717.1 hypothetical protein SAMN05421740_105120 [Parapedobacter koreensis]